MNIRERVEACWNAIRSAGLWLARHPIFFAFALLALPSAATTDAYDVRMRLRVPRVYDNTQSLGYRKYQSQNIRGTMFVNYDAEDAVSLSFGAFTNTTHRVAGEPVTYEVNWDEDALSNFSWCGDNAADSFTIPNANFRISLSPSYKIGEEPLDDLIVTIALTSGGLGRVNRIAVPRWLRGNAAGQLGCNCRAWGHTSPTRRWSATGNLTNVTDVASVTGTVIIRFKERN